MLRYFLAFCREFNKSDVVGKTALSLLLLAVSVLIVMVTIIVIMLIITSKGLVLIPFGILAFILYIMNAIGGFLNK